MRYDNLHGDENLIDLDDSFRIVETEFKIGKFNLFVRAIKEGFDMFEIDFICAASSVGKPLKHRAEMMCHADTIDAAYKAIKQKYYGEL